MIHFQSGQTGSRRAAATLHSCHPQRLTSQSSCKGLLGQLCLQGEQGPPLPPGWRAATLSGLEAPCCIWPPPVGSLTLQVPRRRCAPSRARGGAHSAVRGAGRAPRARLARMIAAFSVLLFGVPCCRRRREATLPQCPAAERPFTGVSGR